MRSTPSVGLVDDVRLNLTLMPILPGRSIDPAGYGLFHLGISEVQSFAVGVAPSIHSPEHLALVALLTELRVQAGLTQAEVAERLGHSQPYVSKYESGETRLDFVQLRQVCHALGTDLVTFSFRYEASLPQWPGVRRSDIR